MNKTLFLASSRCPVSELLTAPVPRDILHPEDGSDLHKTRDEDRTPLPCQQRVFTPSQER